MAFHVIDSSSLGEGNVHDAVAFIGSVWYLDIAIIGIELKQRFRDLLKRRGFVGLVSSLAITPQIFFNHTPKDPMNSTSLFKHPSPYLPLHLSFFGLIWGFSSGVPLIFS